MSTTSTQASSARLTQRAQTSGWVSPTCVLMQDTQEVSDLLYLVSASSLVVDAGVYTFSWKAHFLNQVKVTNIVNGAWSLMLPDVGLDMDQAQPSGFVEFRIGYEDGSSIIASANTEIQGDTITQRSGRAPWMLPGDIIFFHGSWTI